MTVVIATIIIVSLVSLLFYTNKLARQAGVKRPIEICSTSCSCNARQEGCAVVDKNWDNKEKEVL
jgi:hypothetical protein